MYALVSFQKKSIESTPWDGLEPIHIVRPELLDLLGNNAQLRIWLPESLRGGHGSGSATFGHYI